MRKLTKEQGHLLENVRRARRAGIETNTANAVEKALLCSSIDTINFENGSMESLSDNYLIYLQDELANKAIDEEKYAAIKWVGFES